MPGPPSNTPLLNRSHAHVTPAAPAYLTWTVVPLTGSSPVSLRLFCFPFAGAGASVFRGWSEALPRAVTVIPIALPGREHRFTEPTYSELPLLIRDLAPAIPPLLDLPFALFGHSMGAFVAFELARELRRTCGKRPAHLFVSGARAPHLPDREPPMRHLPDAEFAARLRRLNGTPAEVLDTPELLQVVLPTLRSDITLCETYVYRDEEPLDCPITAYGGEGDEKVPVEDLAAWRAHTAGQFRYMVLPGDHFFLLGARAELLRSLSDELSSLVGRDG